MYDRTHWVPQQVGDSSCEARSGHCCGCQLGQAETPTEASGQCVSVLDWSDMLANLLMSIPAAILPTILPNTKGISCIPARSAVAESKTCSSKGRMKASWISLASISDRPDSYRMPQFSMRSHRPRTTYRRLCNHTQHIDQVDSHHDSIGKQSAGQHRL